MSHRRPVRRIASMNRQPVAPVAAGPRRPSGRLVLVLLFAGIIGLLAGVRVGLVTPSVSYQRVALSYVTADGLRVSAVLLQDGRLVALTSDHGYLVVPIDSAQVSQVFADLNRSAPAWAANYPGSGAVDEIKAQLSFSDGSTTRLIQVGAPDTNLALPRSLRDVMAALGRWTREVAVSGAAYMNFNVVLHATRLSAAPAQIQVYGLTKGLDLAAAATDTGQSVKRGDPLAQAWNLFNTLSIGNQRVVRDAGGAIWQVTWALDPASVR